MGEPRNEEEVIQQFQILRDELNVIATKVSEVEGDVQEHDMVLKVLQPIEGDRKCFRLIGGVLVERTVAEVSPAVESNREQLVAVRQFMIVS